MTSPTPTPYSKPLPPTDLVALARRRIEQVTPPEALAWAREHRPDLIGATQRAEAGVKAAAETTDAALLAACRGMIAAYKELAEAYRTRPPEESCPFCGAKAWRRVAGAWVCGECWPASHSSSSSA